MNECTELDFKTFLETTPPYSQFDIVDLGDKKSGFYEISRPDIILYCGSDECNGDRYFRSHQYKQIILEDENIAQIFLKFACSNCKKSVKTYALRVQKKFEAKGIAIKIGEFPQYGSPTSSKLIKLIGPDRDLFLKGRKSENQGLGIGAFTYYRRVVENQRNRIIDEIIKVAKSINSDSAVIQTLENAKNENQFKNSIDMLKDVIPSTLSIQGHNPLTLLYSALSEGIHTRSDDECLKSANAIRVILVELTEKINVALKDQNEINAALNQIAKIRK